MKPKRNKSHGSGTLIASLQALLSKTTSLEIFQFLIKVSLNWLIPSQFRSTSTPLYITDPLKNLIMHRRLRRPPLDMSKPSQPMLSFSSIGATPTLSRIASFRTLSLLVCPQNHRNIRISATLSCWTCRLYKFKLKVSKCIDRGASSE